MIQKKVHLSIIVTACNSQDNISKIMSDVLKQKQKGCVIDKIFVVSDCSTDNTKKAVDKYSSKKIVYIENKTRLGKEGSLNLFLSKHHDRNFIQLDDDIRIFDNLLVSKIAKELRNGGDLVCGHHLPLPHVNFISKLANFGAGVWKKAISLAKNNDRYYCSGQVRGFSKKFINKFKFPEGGWVSEDVYSFYWAKANGFKVVINKSAKVYFKNPTTYSDYIKQMRRFLKSDDNMRKYFGDGMVKKYSVVKTRHKIIALLLEGAKDPFTCISYLLLQLIPKTQALYKKQPRIWDIATSTKTTP